MQSERTPADERPGALAAAADLRDDRAVVPDEDALVTTSRDNLVLSWSAGAARATGYRAHEVIGKHLSFLFPGKHREVDALNARDALAGNPVRNSVVKALRKDGNLVSLIYTVVPIRDHARTVVGLLRICKDVSAFKEAESALRRALIQLKGMDQVEDPVFRAFEAAGAGDVPAIIPGGDDGRGRADFLRILAVECRTLGLLLTEINGLVQADDPAEPPALGL